MPEAWSDKRERQYEHIKKSEEQRGHGKGRAKEIAARTVNKKRAQTGEARRSSRSGSGGRTKEQLYEEAKRRDIRGRSNMTKSELERALGRG